MTPFDLLETMRFDPMEGVCDLDRHLVRMKASAAALGFAFNRHDARNELQAATFRLREPACVRLRLAPSGQIAIEVRPILPAVAEPVIAPVVPLPADPSDIRLAHSTSDRSLYDAARAGHQAVVFARADGWLTEGSAGSLFVERGDGVLLTPPAGRGLLPGVLRGRLLDEGRAVEADLTAADLAGGFWLGNALVGLFRARLP